MSQTLITWKEMETEHSQTKEKNTTEQ